MKRRLMSSQHPVSQHQQNHHMQDIYIDMQYLLDKFDVLLKAPGVEEFLCAEDHVELAELKDRLAGMWKQQAQRGIAEEPISALDAPKDQS